MSKLGNFLLNLITNLLDKAKNQTNKGLDRLERTRTRLINRWYKKALKKEWRSKRKNIPPSELQDSLINEIIIPLNAQDEGKKDAVQSKNGSTSSDKKE